MNQYAVALKVLNLIELGLAVDALRAQLQADEAAGMPWEESQKKAEALAAASIEKAAGA